MEDPSSVLLHFLQLDTKGACFLCLQPLTWYLPGHFANGEAPVAREVSLRSLCRHLHINVRSILVPVLGEENCPPDSCDLDLTVVLCGKCARVTESLTELFRQLEELQMRVNYQVQQFHGILEESQGEEWEVVKERMMAEEARVDVQLVERLRREATRKCGAMLQHQNPVVRLERLRQDIPLGDILEEKEMKVEVEHQILSNRPLTSVLGVTRRPQPKKYRNRTGFRRKHSSGWQEENDNSILKPHYKCKGKERFECTLCHTSAFSTSYNARRHLVHAHLPVFFQSVKQPDVTEQHFEAYCRHALNLETGQQQSKLSRNSNLEQFQCVVCHKRVVGVRNLRFHFISKHYDRVNERVVQLQQKGVVPLNILKTEGRPRPRRTNKAISTVDILCKKHYAITKVGYRCVSCQRTFTGHNPKHHLTNVHPHIFFQDLKSDDNNESEEQFTKSCHRALRLKMKRVRVGGKPHYKCGICETRLSCKSHLSYHLISRHGSEIRQKIVQVQQQKIKAQIGKREGLRSYGSTTKPNCEDFPVPKIDVTEIISEQEMQEETHNYDEMMETPTDPVVPLQQKKGVHFKKVVRTARPRRSPPLSPEEILCEKHYTITKSPQGIIEYKCHACQSTFRGHNPKGHVMNAHPQLIFQDLKQDIDTEEIFADWCHHALNMQAKRVKVGDIWHYKCGLCDARPMGAKPQLRYHLITKHNVEIRQGIVKLQQEKDQYRIRKWEGLNTYGGVTKQNCTGSNGGGSWR